MSDVSETRAERYRRLAAVFERMPEAELREFVGAGGRGAGWGDSRVIDFGDDTVFVKRLRVTSREMADPFGTRNVYELPLYYQYGVGSAGFGAFREVESHRRTTQWVLDGECDAFPLMHHVRVLEIEPRPGTQTEQQQLDYVAYWGGSEELAGYMRDRRNAKHEAVVVLEHVPHTLSDWLLDQPEAIPRTIDQLFNAIRFMRAQGMVHFDAHLQNVVTDGQTPMLTDFGLTLDATFDLSDDERAFLERHVDYDFGEVLYGIGMQLGLRLARLEQLEQERVQAAMGLESNVWGPALLQLMLRVDEFAALVHVPQELLDAVRRYGKVMAHVGEFFDTLRADDTKQTWFDDVELRRLLLDAGIEL